MQKPSTLKINLSGVRGIVGESLTPQLVTSFAAAFGTYCGHERIIIGTDTRPSREMVTQAAVSGLLSVGCTPVLLGIVPVPTLQHHVKATGAAGGICITASHNPIEWNALKFFGPDGITLKPNQFSELSDLYHQGIYPRVFSNKIRTVETDDSAFGKHFSAITQHVCAELIRSKQFTVAVDCCNGAASVATPSFLRLLGCKVIEYNTDPTKTFPRDSKPISKNLRQFSQFVAEHPADLGFAQDSDADRVALVDSKGNPLGEDLTAALAIRHYIKKKPGPIVAGMSTSKVIEDIVKTQNYPFFQSKVGELNVIEKMQQVGAALGGEGNGGVILNSVNTCRDSFVAMALILESLAEEERTLSDIRSQLPHYHIVKARTAYRPRHISRTLRLLKHFYHELPLDLTDGLKVNWKDKWLHVRGSKTEPIIRIVAEAKTVEEAQALVNQVSEYLR